MPQLRNGQPSVGWRSLKLSVVLLVCGSIVPYGICTSRSYKRDSAFGECLIEPRQNLAGAWWWRNASAPALTSVAVRRFENAAGDETLDYLALALPDEISRKSAPIRRRSPFGSGS